MHALHPWQLSTLAPAFAPGGTSHAADEDVGVDGVMVHASSPSHVRRQAGQISEIGGGVMRPLVEPFVRHTCGKTCEMRAARRHRPPRAAPPTLKCVRCKRPFQPKQRGKKARYCSRRCWVRAKIEKRKARTMAQRFQCAVP
jgi:hypothetical protein